MAVADSFHRVKTCAAPLVVEGELVVYLNSNFTKAKVTLSDIEEYPTRVITAGGPVTTLEYDTARSTERITIAVDGYNILEALDPITGRFKKIATLTCY